MRVNDSGVYMLEVAPRPIGGLCARALRFANDLSLEDVIVLHAVDRMPRDLTPAAPASGVMMIPIPRAGVYQSVSGIDEGRGAPGVLDVIITAKPGQKLVPLPEGASYLGFIFANGDSPAEVEAALRQAHAALKFDISVTLNVIPF
jgi:L-amino acid ligase C-terminal domain 2